MSETPTWTVDIDNSDSGGGSWSIVTAPNQPEIQVRGAGHSDLADRIARLLAEDDERIEREAMRARVIVASAPYGDTTAHWPDKLIDWASAACVFRNAATPLAELRALEAAYRATLEQP